MHRIVLTAAAGLAATALALGASAPAQASHPHGTSPLRLDERVDFVHGVIRFTAKEPLCGSGVQQDEVVGAEVLDERRDIQRFTIDSHYVCDGGRGTFDATKVIVVDYAPDGSSVSSGPIRFHGGTGPFRRLEAVGTDRGRVGADGYGSGVVVGVVLHR